MKPLCGACTSPVTKCICLRPHGAPHPRSAWALALECRTPPGALTTPSHTGACCQVRRSTYGAVCASGAIARAVHRVMVHEMLIGLAQTFVAVVALALVARFALGALIR